MFIADEVHRSGVGQVRALAVVVLAGTLLGLGTRAAQRPLPLDELPLLFADDAGIAHSQNVVRRFHRGVVSPLPMIVADRPWEGDRVYIFGSVYYDRTTKLYRMWYMGAADTPDGPSTPHRTYVAGFRDRGRTPVLFATSKDGSHWTKPSLGLYAFNGSTHNNIVFDLNSPSVLWDHHDPDAARRFKMLGTSGGNYWSAVSPDGLHWRSEPAHPIFSGSDTITVVQNPRTHHYLAYYKRMHLVRGYRRRVVWVSTSDDFLTWSPAKLALAPDSVDDTWATHPPERTEFYNLSVFPHAGGFLGFVTVFRIMSEIPRDTVGPGQSPVDGPIDVELVTSSDGLDWRRTWPRQPIIPPGKPGTFNGGAILGLANEPVDVGRETWVYFTVLTTTHGAPMPPKRINIGRAVWRRDGFASLDAGPQGARIETVPVRFSQPRLVINADASRGWLRAAVVETDGTPIAGLGAAECQPLRTDAVDAVLHWRGGKQPPTDRAVRIVLSMADCELYSIAASYATIRDGSVH